ncbi:hypothetical protein GGS21DRAFT_268074 [Xylaria nigripes]|nr:hypothetical protein GGS21DRAFT_268074 [Xylaria nigripes]
MAAPASKTVHNLSGKWTLNKALSDSTDPPLALQGIGWILRKGIAAASVLLTVKQYTDDAGTSHIDIDQVASGLKGTSELRVLDWTEREHKDWIFGRVDGKSRFITLSELTALVAPDGQARKEKWCDSDYLVRDWISDAEGNTEFVISFVRADAGWTTLQVWGFQMVGGERRYTRNIAVAKGDKFENFRLVFDSVPE